MEFLHCNLCERRNRSLLSHLLRHDNLKPKKSSCEHILYDNAWDWSIEAVLVFHPYLNQNPDWRSKKKVNGTVYTNYHSIWSKFVSLLHWYLKDRPLMTLLRWTRVRSLFFDVLKRMIWFIPSINTLLDSIQYQYHDSKWVQPLQNQHMTSFHLLPQSYISPFTCLTKF